MDGKFDLDFDLSNTYKIKIKQIHEKKLSEFNFKLLHRLLPCRYNLVTWGKTNNSLCEFCGQTETIEHMLFMCNEVKQIWDIFLKQNNCDFDVRFLILGNNNLPLQWAISLIQFLIFKIWTLRENNQNPFSMSNFIRKELEIRYKTYMINGYDDVNYILKKLLDIL